MLGRRLTDVAVDNYFELCGCPFHRRQIKANRADGRRGGFVMVETLGRLCLTLTGPSTISGQIEI